MSESLIIGSDRATRARRHDATGRSTSAKPVKKVNTGPPKGVPWVWHSAAMLRSAAWRGMGIHARRLLEFLELEHMAHGGNENGRLCAPYAQLREWGIGRRFIRAAIDDAERRGLLRVERGGRKGTVMNETSRFRLTYLAAKTADGAWQEPTNDWLLYGGK